MYYWSFLFPISITDSLPEKTKCGQSCCIKLVRYCQNEESQIVKENLGSTEIGRCLDESKCKVICK